MNENIIAYLLEIWNKMVSQKGVSWVYSKMTIVAVFMTICGYQIQFFWKAFSYMKLSKYYVYQNLSLGNVL